MELILHNKDCMEVMKDYQNNYFDLAVVDPPYGIGASKQKLNISKLKSRKNGAVARSHHKNKDWDNLAPNKQYFDELFRVSKEQIIWGGNYFTDILPPTNSYIFWYKFQSLETRSDGELAWVSINKPLKVVELIHDGFKKGANVGRNSKVKYNKPYSGHQTIHPTQKPVKLYEWIYINYAEKGMKILDTHLGSGSNAIAAHNCNMGEFVGCEIDKEYFDSAEKRIEDTLRQERIFV